MTEAASVIAATAGGSLLPLPILVPAAGVLLSFLLGGRQAERIALGLMPVQFGVAIAIASLVWRSGEPLVYVLGGYVPPLGIALRADGFSAVMLVTASLIMPAAGLYARVNFSTPRGVTERRGPLVVWTLLQAVQAALSLIFLGGDLFNLYVALELLTFAAVPLVCLDGRPETLAAALRYLMFALFGALFYLLGAALLYGAYGTLDIVLLSRQIRAEPAVWLAAGLMTAGLLAKTALFPLHLWLPPAHANAPAAASAVLSGLVVKGSFFLIVRLWFNVLPALPNAVPGTILATLGSAAILSGSVLALRQERLKLLIAYSTVAQIGYLFLMFPLASGPWAADAFSGGVMQALSHAFAKAAMFLSAGLIAESLGHDRIAGLGGAGARDAGHVPGARSRRAVAHGAAAERRLRRQMALDEGLDRGRPMGLGGRDAGRRTARRRISLPGARAGAFRRAPATEGGASPQSRNRRAGAGASPRCCSPSRRRRSSPFCRSAVRPQALRCDERVGVLRRRRSVRACWSLRSPRRSLILAAFLAPKLRAGRAGDGAVRAASCPCGRGSGDRRRAVGVRTAGAAHELPARSARGDAACRRGAGLDRRQRLRPGGRDGQAERRPLRRLVAPDDGRQSRRVHRRRPR